MVRKTKISKTFCKMLIIVCIAAILYSLARSFLFSREGLDNHGLTDFVYDSSNATLPLPTNFSGTYTINDQTFIITQTKDRTGKHYATATIELVSQDPEKISSYGKISNATIDNNIMTWKWSGDGTNAWGNNAQFFARLISVGTETGLNFKHSNGWTQGGINWYRISKHDNTL